MAGGEVVTAVVVLGFAALAVACTAAYFAAVRPRRPGSES
jgi:hypothetical protein